MDKFGYIRGRRGPPGPQGKNALPIHTWFPSSTLRMFREDEECTFYFNTLDDGVMNNGKGKFALRDRFGINHALCLKNFQKPIKVGKFYGIPLNDSLYKVKDVRTATVGSCICLVALTFRVKSEIKGDVTIFTNESETRGVTISKESLNILGTDPLKLKYQYRDWNTIIIQYSNITAGDAGKCFFVLNGHRGFFRPHENINKDDHIVYIGGNSKGKNTANVLLVNFELYYKILNRGQLEPSDYLVPQEIVSLVDLDMNKRIDDEEIFEPSQSETCII